jgi:hypothetical protein
VFPEIGTGVTFGLRTIALFPESDRLSPNITSPVKGNAWALPAASVAARNKTAARRVRVSQFIAFSPCNSIVNAAPSLKNRWKRIAATATSIDNPSIFT